MAMVVMVMAVVMVYARKGDEIEVRRPEEITHEKSKQKNNCSPDSPNFVRVVRMCGRCV